MEPPERRMPPGTADQHAVPPDARRHTLPMKSEDAVQVGTAGWQADYVSQNLAHQVAYLETVSASSLFKQVAANAIALLSLAPGRSVLEVGCGSGVLLSALAQRVAPGGRVVGVDHADAFVAAARAMITEKGLAEAVTVDIGDACNLQYGTATFDAAHCERVLMHLEDPNAAIREMARVVRPGGMVVIAEPDWTGIQHDHPDRQAFDLVYAKALPMRNKDIGLTLYRRFGELGLQQRKYMPVTAVITDFATFRMYGLRLEPAVEALIAEGALSADRLSAVVPQLDSASASGTYYSVATVHVVAGVVPA